jgi:hypothetical protein
MLWLLIWLACFSVLVILLRRGLISLFPRAENQLYMQLMEHV